MSIPSSLSTRKKAVFKKDIYLTGKVGLILLPPSYAAQEMYGVYLNKEDEPLEDSEITPKLLHMLAMAYETGYKEALQDAAIKLHDLNDKQVAPKERIVIANDYRDIS